MRPASARERGVVVVEDDVFHFLLSRISGQLRDGNLRTDDDGIFLSAYRKTPIK